MKGQGKVFLMAATLRPETMAGQTNCWALPEGDYGAYKGLNNEVYIMHPRSARNLAFQDLTPTPGQAECLLRLKGKDLIGLPLKVSSLTIKDNVQVIRNSACKCRKLLDYCILAWFWKVWKGYET